MIGIFSEVVHDLHHTMPLYRQLKRWPKTIQVDPSPKLYKMQSTKLEVIFWHNNYILYSTQSNTTDAYTSKYLN